MKYKHIVLLTFSISGVALSSSFAQGTPPTIQQPVALPAPVTRTVTPALPPHQSATKLQSFEFAGADLDTVMTMYCEWTGKIYLKNDNVNASISIKADKLTTPECIDVVETILSMNNIVIVPYGEKFIKVIQANSADLTGEGLPISLNENTEYTATDKLVTQIIPLKNVQIPEVQTAIQHLMHSYGKIQTLEASNSLLITDTESNILRIRELVDFMDQASAKIEPRFYQITYAEAGGLAATLNEIITMAQSGTSTGSTTRRSTASRIIRARSTTAAATAPSRAAISSTEAGEQTIIQGNVKVMADERTNLILIFSQKENFDFFDKMIKTLDVEVEPAITFEVVNLEYADAEELAGTLNDLVGAAQGRTTGSSSSSASRSRSSSSGRSSSSRTPAAGNAAPSPGAPGMMVTPNATPTQTASIENLSQLSENTKILADTRSNSILLMGRKSDIAAIKNVIANLDVMLEQVMIEADIFEIGLTKGIDHGIQWLYKSQGGDKIGAWDAASTVTNSLSGLAAGSLKYYQNVTGINTELAIKLAASDTDSQVLGTPVIMTTDNTEASISIGEQRPVVTATDSYANSSGTLRSSYEYKDIGIQLTVTPRINPQRFVVMEISQKANQVDTSPVEIDGNKVPVILNREFDASVAIPDRGTIALGGLMKTDTKNEVTKIPILGDIPLLGRYLFSRVHKEKIHRELLVLLTPYVVTNHEELLKETERIYKKTTLKSDDWNWSDSSLRNIPTENE